MAKKFFYVCAGLFFLALSFELGARSARAQGASGIAGGFFGPDATISVGTTMYTVRLNTYTGTDGPPYSLLLPRSGAVQDVRSVSGGGSIGETWVLYQDGDIYEYLPGTGWQHIVNLLGATPTAAQSTSWGRVKSTYRK
jgi:hypothetical protein